MRLLDRYLLRELLVPFAYCLAGFLIFWVSFDLFARMSEFQKLHLKARDLLELYTVNAPSILATVLPMAFLLSLLYALTNHARHNELTAMRSAGMSLARISVPYVVVGFILSLAVFAMNELWVPGSAEAAEEIEARYQTDKSTTSYQRQWERKLGFYNHLERRWWFVESYHLFTGEMIRPHVIWLLPDGGRREILADHGAFIDGVWNFTNVHSLSYEPKSAIPVQEELDDVTMPEFRETPEQIRSEIKINKLRSFKQARKTVLSIQEIFEYKRLHPAGMPAGLRAVLETKLHGQMAAPWVSLVVVAIALPFGARSGRRNVAVGVASSIFICFAYFVLLQLSLALGAGGKVEPWVAAWMPNALFGLTGLILIWRMR
jgi:lipopolysaccharide export system permease protein